MGIRLLNTFLQSSLKNNTNRIELCELRGKRIVIDASIYLYRFAAMNNLIENIYVMCSIFRYYNIHALFIFDGKYRRQEKRNTLIKRSRQKIVARDSYKKCENKMSTVTNYKEKARLSYKMGELRRTFTKVTPRDINNVKTLLDSYGIMHRQAVGEADELCAALVLENAAYACMSEDTDLFVYGCPRVLKYFSLINHTAILYKLDDILNIMDISYQNFKTLCFMSGTDYIIDVYQNIFDNFRLYKEYESEKPCTDNTFLEWLTRKKYLNKESIEKIQNECKVYGNSRDSLKNIDYFLIRNKYVNREQLKNILKMDGFVFPE